MNQEKIGKFIALSRKRKNLTQEALAEKLGVSKNAVSKWERGLSLMDISLLKPLSQLLDISILELLNGEEIEKEERDKKSEKLLIETIDYSNEKIKKVKKNKKILVLITIVVTILSFIILDTIVALISINSPLLSFKKELEGDSYVDKGLILNTYYCKEKDIVTVYQKLNSTYFRCPIETEEENKIFETTKYLYSLKNNPEELLEQLDLSFYGHYKYEIKNNSLLITYKDEEGFGNILTNDIKVKEKTIIMLTLLDDIKSVEWKILNDNKKITIDSLKDIYGNLKNYSKSEESFQKLLINLYYYEVEEPITSSIIKVTSEKINFKVKNNSNKNFNYGESYSLEKLDDGKFICINKDMNFNLPSYNLKSGMSINYEYSFNKKLEKGTYRIVKEYIESKNNDNEYGKKYYVLVNFVIE